MSAFPRENLPSRFKFKEYCPMVFRNLRERFGIDDQDYQVRGCLGTAAGFRDEGVRKPQDKHGPESLSYCVSPVHAHSVPADWDHWAFGSF